jgi:hypothetical protein
MMMTWQHQGRICCCRKPPPTLLLLLLLLHAGVILCSRMTMNMTMTWQQ